MQICRYIRLWFGDTEFIYPDQLSLKIVASNVQAGPKYDYEPDADTDGMKEFLNGLDLAFFRDPQYDEITPWEQWYAYSTHPTIDVTTCEELQENPYGADLAWGYYDCTNNRGETRDTLYGVSPNLIFVSCQDFQGMAAVAVKCTGLNFRSCFDDLYSNHLQLFAIARPFDPPGFERSQQVDRDNLPDSLDVSFEFTNGDMDPIINSTYCYGTGGSGASGGSPHANWHGDHEFTADVSMTLSFTCEFETQSGICCLPSGSVSATRKECGELCGIYFPENDQSAICPDVQTPTQKQCSDTKPGEKWYPTNAGTLTTDDPGASPCMTKEECINSGCECWRCYEDSSGNKRCSNTPISGTPTTGCHKTKDECEQNCGDCWSKYEKAVGWYCGGPPPTSCIVDEQGHPADISWPDTITLSFNADGWSPQAQNIRDEFGQTADSTLPNFFNGLSFTLQRVDQLNPWGQGGIQYSMFPQKDRFGAYTHDVMTGEQVNLTLWGTLLFMEDILEVTLTLKTLNQKLLTARFQVSVQQIQFGLQIMDMSF